MTNKTIVYIVGAIVVVWILYTVYQKEQKSKTGGHKTDKIMIGGKQMRVLVNQPEFGDRRGNVNPPLYAGTGDLVATINTF
jgi:hypothetical protein